MSYSRITYAASAGQVVFAVPFSYLDKTYVEVRVAGVLQDPNTGYSWPTSTTIAMPAGVSAGTLVELRRNTPKVARLVTYRDASMLTEGNLNMSAAQVFDTVQEVYDDMAVTVKVGADGTIDAQGLRIKNGAAPMSGTDLVTRDYADSVIVTASASAAAAASSATSASTSATNAATSASSASTSATASGSSATSASGSATTATSQAINAASSATAAASSATAAASSATAAASSATEAAASSLSASNSATAAAAAYGYAGVAGADAAAASTSATNAANSATAAAASATSASTSATSSTGSASSAASSATAASGSASEAATSATNAASSATAAASSATTATTQAGNASAAAAAASGSANAAASSATAASGSASSAATSATTATTQATTSTNSANTASTYASNSAASASAASASADSAAASAAAAAGSAGNTVKASSTDTSPSYLNTKLVVTGALTKTVTNSGADERVSLGVSVPVTSVFGRTGAVALTMADITPIDGAGSGLDADLLDGNHSSAFELAGHTHSGVYVAADNGHNNIGSFCFARYAAGGLSPGATVAGSSLMACSVDAQGALYYDTTLSGTWRLLGLMGPSGPAASLFQRIS